MALSIFTVPAIPAPQKIVWEEFSEATLILHKRCARTISFALVKTFPEENK